MDEEGKDEKEGEGSRNERKKRLKDEMQVGGKNEKEMRRTCVRKMDLIGGWGVFGQRKREREREREGLQV